VLKPFFFAYFMILTTYFSVLAILSTYQFPGYVFQSGRLVILTCMPILLISPIVTLWMHHDVEIYFSVMGATLVTLLLGAQRIIANWSTWYLDIPCVTDDDVANWY
jgi:hypothetical protein